MYPAAQRGLASAVSLLALLGAGCERATPPRADTTSEAALVAPPTTWITNDDDGLARVKAEHRPRFVVAHADWCSNCRDVIGRVLPDPRVREQLARFVPVSLDVSEPSDATNAIGERYPSHVLPAIRIYDSDGRLADEVDGRIDPAPLAAMLAKVR